MSRSAQETARNFILACVAYAILVFVSVWIMQQMPEVPWRFLVALLPMLPLVFAFRTFLSYLSGLDELQQRIQLQAIGFAAGATGMVTLTYGLLEGAGLPSLNMCFVFPILCLFWGGASLVLTRRYE
jgi:bacteriorhodopsin